LLEDGAENVEYLIDNIDVAKVLQSVTGKPGAIVQRGDQHLNAIAREGLADLFREIAASNGSAYHERHEKRSPIRTGSPR
jgi:hypothetical protein